ncbi:MAG: sorbosone dehydrogenase [Gammaproteobacteria bacterium]|nr:sorbosone dehydrogenase [Gammaproteobacteria bacterium]|tara:strand:+ start:6240 stop:7394 length:1155 start_codon:yes stop_codon:yes gene_type:complete
MKILNLKSFEKFGNYIFLIILFFGTKLASENAISQLKLPNGFEISIYASDIESPRQITETKEGFIIIGSKNGKNIYALNDLDKDGVAEKKILIAKDLQNPTGVVFFEDNLYFSEIDKIWIIKDIDDWLMSKNFNKLPKKEIFLDDLPSETWHGYKYIDFGPDGNLYIPVGVPCNICLEPQTKDKRFAAIHKFENGELVTVASGVRNSVGFDWHPSTNKLYFSDNGRDWLGDNSPSCELNVIEKDGSFFGYPYKHAKDVIDPEFGKLIPNVDMEFVDPIAELGPHVAPLGITFYDKNIFPEKYKNSLFVALHGSWNKYNGKSGYKVIFVKLDKNGGYLYQEDFITGWLQNEKDWGRPVSPFIMSDGSMLISDDKFDAIYRIQYKG